MRITIIGNDRLIIIKSDNYPIMDIHISGIFCGSRCELKGVDEL